MSNQDSSAGLQGTRLEKIGKNGAEMLGKKYRDKIVAAVNALFNLEVLVPSTDGSNIQAPQKARIDISELSMRITMPPLNAYSTSSGAAGSGLATQFAICYDAGPYWVALASGNGTWGVVTQNIAKPYKLRTSGGPTSETIRGVTYTYGYSAAAAVSFTFQGITFTSVTPYSIRSVTGSDGSSETDYTIPDPVLGDIIYAMPTDGVIGVPYTILTVAVVNGGSGYSANQILTISGGSGTAATIKVLTVSSGKILTCQMASPGSYGALPTMTGATVTTGSATFNLTQAPNLIDLNIDGRAWAGSTSS